MIPRKRTRRPAQQPKRRTADQLSTNGDAAWTDTQRRKPEAKGPDVGDSRSDARSMRVLNQTHPAGNQSGRPHPFHFDRSRYPAVYLMTPRTEAQVQREILRALAQAGTAAWAFDAGGKAMRGRAGAGGAGAGTAGLPDVIGILPGGRALFIEVKRPAWIDGTVKRPAGKPSPAQVNFLIIACDKGAAAGVAWSVSDALEIAGVGK